MMMDLATNSAGCSCSTTARGSLERITTEVSSKNKESHCMSFPGFTSEKHQESGIISNTNVESGIICPGQKQNLCRTTFPKFFQGADV